MPVRPDSSSPTQASPPAQSGNPAQPAATFEASLTELNDIVTRLESGSLGLSESIGAYERGVVILRGLHEQLADVEERVRTLVRIDEQGRPILAATDVDSAGRESVATDRSADGPTDAGGRRPSRTAARPGRPKRLPGMDDAGDGT